MNFSNPISSTKTLTGTLCLGVALSTMTACGSAGPGDGEGAYFLSLVGDRNVYLESGERYDLQVRYHDADDEPLAGVVDFRIDGDAGGARLVSRSSTTDSNGVATVTLDADADQQTSFYVEATAPDAGTATFSVTVEEPQDPLEPNGVYEVNSTLDLVSGLEDGTVRDVVHYVLDFTDDPGTFLLMLAAENTDFITEDQAETFGPALTTLLEDNAPQFVADLLTFGENFNEVVRNFGVVSELEVDGTRSTLRAEHQLTGVVFAYGTEERHFTMSDMDVDNIEAKSVSFSMAEREDEVSLGEHALPFSYGSMIRIAIEQVILQSLTGHDNVFDFLEAYVPCEDIANWAQEEIGLSPDIAKTLCTTAISLAANELMNLIEGIDDTGLELVVSGTARPVDTDGDSKPDVLLDGRWEGTLEYAAGSVSATLDPTDNEFRAERIRD